MTSSTHKLALFIDGANLYATAKTLGFDIDYKRLLREFQGRGELLRAFYYTAVIEDQEYSSIRPLVDWLDYNGYTVVTKATRNSPTRPAAARSKATWTSSSRSTCHGARRARRPHRAVLRRRRLPPLVEAVQRRGRRVSVVSTSRTQPAMVADELRRQADHFVDLVDLQPLIAREGGRRASDHHDEPRERLIRRVSQQSTMPARRG